MLHSVAQLPKDLIRHVDRVLRNEVNTHALRANETDNLLHLVFDHLRQIGEEQVRLVEEKHQLWFFRIANFRKFFKELCQQPEQKGRIELRRLDELVSGKNIDDTTPILVGLQQIIQVQ